MKLSLHIPKIENRIDEFFREINPSITRLTALPPVHKYLHPEQADGFGKSYISVEGSIVKQLNPVKYRDDENIEYTLEALKNEIVNYAEITELCPDFFCKMIGYHYDATYREIAIVMENCGMDLIDYENAMMDRQGLTHIDWINIFSQIATALQCLHENGFVHLDIKPDNITINSSGKIKFIDAGSLTKLSLEPNDIIKSTFGTPGYMPEQRTRGHARNENLKKFDIYALGAYANKIKYQNRIKIFNDDFLDSMLGANPPNITTIIGYLEDITMGYLVFDFNFTPRTTSRFDFANLPPTAAAAAANMPPPPGYTRFELGGSNKKKSKSRRHGRRQKKRQTRR